MLKVRKGYTWSRKSVQVLTGPQGWIRGIIYRDVGVGWRSVGPLGIRPEGKIKEFYSGKLDSQKAAIKAVVKAAGY